MPDPLPLPTLDPVTLLRALCKRARPLTSAAIPSTRHVLQRIDAAALDRYRAAFDFHGDHAPLTWYYLPAQRAQVATLLAPGFPLRLVGSVHTANALERAAALRLDAPLVLDTAVALRPPTDRGAIHADVETVATQHGTRVFTCRSAYLMVGGRQRDGARKPPAQPALPTIARWHVAADAGRRYAALSGDWNPIHLWPWSARLLGQRAPIIHGMHTLARTCAALEAACGRPLIMLDGRFRAPIALGSDVRLGADLANGSFAVEAGARMAVEGRFRHA